MNSGEALVEIWVFLFRHLSQGAGLWRRRFDCSLEKLSISDRPVPWYMSPISLLIHAVESVRLPKLRKYPFQTVERPFSLVKSCSKNAA